MEDGYFNIPEAIANGWHSLLIAPQGYLIIPAKILTLLSLSLSGIFYPEVAYILTFATTILILIALTSKYNTLKGKEFIPLIIAFLPYDPEVFSTPLYIFWWASLLLIIPIFSSDINTYNSKPQAYLVTISAIIIGCLSSPICIFILPVMILRTYVKRSVLDYISTGIWALLAVWQYSLIRYNSAIHEINYTDNIYINLKAGISKHFGNYLYYNGWLTQHNLFTYILFSLFLGFGAWATYRTVRFREPNLFHISATFLMILAAITSSSLKGGLVIDPFFAGPRYFFFSYIFISLFLLALIGSMESFFIQVSCISIIALSCSLVWLTDFPKFYRVHEPLDWRVELKNCLSSEEPYQLNIQYYGVRADVINREYSYSECKEIANSGILTKIYGWKNILDIWE